MYQWDWTICINEIELYVSMILNYMYQWDWTISINETGLYVSMRLNYMYQWDWTICINEIEHIVQSHWYISMRLIYVSIPERAITTNLHIVIKTPYSTIYYGGFLLPEKYLLFERSKKRYLRFPKKIWGTLFSKKGYLRFSWKIWEIFFLKKDTTDFLEKSEKSFFGRFK